MGRLVWWSLRDFLLVYLLLPLLAGIVLAAAAGARGATPDPAGPGAMLAILFATTLGAVLLVVRQVGLDGDRLVPELLRGATRPVVLAGAATGVATAVFSMAAGTLGAWLGADPSGGPNEAALRALIAQLPGWAVVGLLVLAVPFVEELIFRRVLFRRIAAAGHPLAGIVVTGVLFTLAHAPFSPNGPGASVLLWLIYFTMSSAFCLVYWSRRSLLAPWLAHAANNAVALGMATAGSG